MNQLPTRYSNPNHSPGYQLWRVTNIWQRHMRQALKDLDLTHVQFVLLAVTVKLSELGEPTNQAHIAEAAGMDKMMASQVLRALEVKQLITRTPDAADARAMVISVTEAGFDVTCRAIVKVEEADQEFFAILGDEDRTLALMLSRLAGG
jgi:DNA-binding MarR family transcriptional regulator